MWITRVSINNPVFATMVMIGIAVLGLFAYNRLRVEQMPDVSLPFVLVLTNYPGRLARGRRVRRDEAARIRDQHGLRREPHPVELEGRAERGLRRVPDVDGHDEGDAGRARQDRAGTSRLSARRQGSARHSRRAGERAARGVARGPVAHDEPARPQSLTDQTIVKALENVPGVARIDVSGRVTRQILVQIKPNAVTSLGIGVDQVINAIRAANQDVPAGRITRGQDGFDRPRRGQDQGSRAVRPDHRRPAGRRAGLPVAGRGRHRRREGGGTRSRGSTAARRSSIDIQKAQDANIVDTGRGITAAIALLKTRLPADVELRVANSTADSAERAVNRVKSTIVEGGLLTVLIVFLFLHSWRSTIITGLTLPIAVIATFIALYAFGFTLNFLTLMALSLCIGLLIDDAIVVRENIVRHLGLGKNHVTAAREGTDEIGLAVMATTFAIVAVFVPISFMSGIIGRFFFQFGVTVAVAVLVSLFVSFTLDPMLSAVWHDPPGVALRARAVARPLHGKASSTASNGCMLSTARSSSGRSVTASASSRSPSSPSSRASRSCRW